MAAIDWCKLDDQQKYDRVVEALFVKEYADESGETYAVNGVGGDGGIDIRIRHNGKFIIAQLKYFPEGFSGGWKKVRQAQIRDSYKTALQHDPDEWWLVVPTTLKPGERAFVNGLGSRQRPPRTCPRVFAFDQTQLDLLAAKHQDVIGHFLRDQLAEAAQNYRLEDALNMTQNDIVDRVAALARQADTLDPDWRWELFTDNGTVGRQLVAKHSQAAERSPITIRVKAKFEPEHADLRRQLELVMGYGTPGELDLPPAVVTTFEVDGPPLVAERSEHVGLTWKPVGPIHVGLPFTVSFEDTNGRHVASYVGKTTWTGAAHLGASVHVQFNHAVTLKFLIPRERSNHVNMNVSISFAGCAPADVARAITLLEHLDSDEVVTLDLDGAAVGKLLPDTGQSVFGDLRADILSHKSVAEDLVVLQESTSQYFGYPEQVTTVDRVLVRCLRLLVEGHCIVMPDMEELTQHLNGEDGPALRALLALLARGPHSIRGDMDEFSQDVFGHLFRLGPARMYAPQVLVVDSDAIIAGLDGGTAAGMRLTLRGEDGYGFWIFLTEKFIPDADGRVRPVSLGLPDYDDAPDVARALDGLVYATDEADEADTARDGD